MSDGSNPMRWDCTSRGCFNQLRRPKIERFAACFPGRIAMSDIDATIHGGGITGQAGALRLGIARGLVALDSELRTPLKRAGFLTRDAREKESKKYGLKKARKAPQYSKR